MEYLIDRKVWNKVIKKVSPSLGLEIKEGFKKNDNIRKQVKIKKDFVLKLPSKRIYYGFIEIAFESYHYRDVLKRSKELNRPNRKFIEVERAMLEVLIETQGLPDDVKYYVNQQGEYIIEQDQNIEFIEKGFVYLIRNDDIFKIGITDNLLRRFNQLKPDEVLNVVRCSNYENLEKDLHKKFKKNRIPQTEYFRLNKSQIEQVNIEMTKGAEF